MAHIFRSFVISALMGGFLAHLILPFSSQAQKMAFSQWLNHNVVASGNETEIKLRNTIRELPEQSGDFSILLQQASQLVSNYQEGFRIGYDFAGNEHKQESHRVAHWLVGQWNIFQHQHSGHNAILPDLTPPFYKWFSNSLPLHFVAFASSERLSRFCSTYNLPLFQPLSATFLTPLISGISINAP